MLSSSAIKSIIEDMKNLGIDEKAILSSLKETEGFVQIARDTYAGAVERSELVELYRHAKDYIIQAYKFKNVSDVVSNEPEFGLGMILGVLLILEHATMPTIVTGRTDDSMKAISQAATSWLARSSEEIIKNPPEGFKNVGGFAIAEDRK